jgi:hypothetical protein
MPDYMKFIKYKCCIWRFFVDDLDVWHPHITADTQETICSFFAKKIEVTGEMILRSWKSVKKNVERVFNFFRSVKLTIALIILLLLTCGIGALIPQINIASEAELEAWRIANPLLFRVVELLSLDGIYSSWWFAGLLGLFFLNTLVCTLFRIAPIFKRRGIDLLKGAGSLVFHLGLLVILIGAAISPLTKSGFELLIIEGQTLSPEHIGKESKVRLDKVEVPFDERYGIQKDMIGTLTFLGPENQEIQKIVHANYPASYRGFDFVISRYGFAPQFVLRDFRKKVVFYSFVSLETGKGLESVDSFPLLGTPYTVEVLFYPDAKIEKGNLVGLTPELKNPMARLVVKKGEAEICSGIVGPDEKVNLGRYNLTFDSVRYWNRFTVTKDRGIIFVEMGFFLGIIGMIMRFAVPVLCPGIKK